MDINATLLIQVIVFLVLIWGTMRFIWPVLLQILDDRRDKIADGLAAAEQGVKSLELAKYKADEQIVEAKAKAEAILEKANQRGHNIIEEAKHRAREEGERLLALAQAEIEQQYNTARDQLLQEISSIALTGAEKIVSRAIRPQDDAALNELLGEV